MSMACGSFVRRETRSTKSRINLERHVLEARLVSRVGTITSWRGRQVLEVVGVDLTIEPLGLQKNVIKALKGVLREGY